jgi:hypothetical protein
MYENCEMCGIEMYSGKICWLCDIEKEGGYIWVKYAECGKIGLWSSSNESGDLSQKIEAKDFCELVREQYPRGE